MRFLSAGGKLLIAPILPTLDENFRPCILLAEFLNARMTADGPDGLVNAWRPADAEAVVFDACTGDPIGWEIRTDTKGTVLLLERNWTMGRRWDEQMLREAVNFLGWQPVVRCDNPNVWTSLLSDGHESLLFLMNFFTGHLTARVSYQDPRTRNWIDKGSQTLEGINVKVIDQE